MTSELTRIDQELTRIDLRYDLPHASYTSPSQIHVSVIISCKTVNSEVNENTAPRSDEERCPGVSLLTDTVGVSDRTLRVT